MKFIACAAFLVAAVAIAAPTGAIANDDIRSIDTFYLGMTIEEFKAEVEKKFDKDPEYWVDKKFVNEGGETDILAIRALGGFSGAATAVFKSSLSEDAGAAYGIMFKQPISGEYAENHELIWNSVIEKYGEPTDYILNEIKGSVFKISARWVLGNSEIDPNTCALGFNVRSKYPVEEECGTFVFVDLRAANSSGNLVVGVLDHEAGAADFKLRNPDADKAEGPKF
ncbi:hypothetical protein FMN50_01895 [Rhodobacterales bacterium]|nr:hypothetical protein FMN50_01895 [Rhodobacterales bacterium]